jgi:predicted RNase H-like nuclease (RuvC/YqgF family)
MFKNKNVDEAILTIKTHMENQDKKIEKYQKQLEEFNKDSEIQKLKDEIDTMYRENIYVGLSENEKIALDTFKEKHYKTCKGNTIYILEGTGIGTVIKLQCSKCKEMEDITDTDSW